MSRIDAACFCAAILTTIVLLLTQGFPALPVWSLFITWACFFHLGGDKEPAAAFRITVTHAACGPMVRSSYHADQQAHSAGV